MKPPGLTPLIYELLDAHGDTVELAQSLPDDSWRAHIDYLRALQRRGRELLASATAIDYPSYPTNETLQ